MPSIPLDDAAGHPITVGEMQAILEPLRLLLERMDRTLCSNSSNIVGTGEEVQGVIAVKSQDLVDTTPFPPNLFETALRHQAGDDSGVPEAPRGTPPPLKSLTGSKKTFSNNVKKTSSGLQPKGGSNKKAVHSAGHIDFHRSVELASLSSRGSVKTEFEEILQIRQRMRETFDFNGGLFTRFISRTTECFLKVADFLSEPERGGCLFEVSVAPSFQTWCMLVVIFNSALVAFSADWQLKHIGASEPFALTFLEIACLCWFIIELAIRIGAHRLHFFVNHDAKWNTFDFALVCISVGDIFVDKVLGVGGNSKNVGFMRMLRLLKVARVLRAFRTFKFFNALSQLVDSLHKAIVPMFWGFIMLSFLLYIFALVFMQGLAGVIQNQALESDTQNDILYNFGSLTLSLLSLYMSITGGNDWGVYYKIVSHAGIMYEMAFLLFTFVVNLALFNILTGMLVEKAFVSAKPDRAEGILKQRKMFEDKKQQFVDICKILDDDGSGTISWQEFQRHMTDPLLTAYLAYIGIEVDDVDLFFETCLGYCNAQEDKELPIEHFVKGCLHMKGTAMAIDMQRLLLEVREVRFLQDSLSSQCDCEQPTSTPWVGSGRPVSNPLGCGDLNPTTNQWRGGSGRPLPTQGWIGQAQLLPSQVGGSAGPPPHRGHGFNLPSTDPRCAHLESAIGHSGTSRNHSHNSFSDRPGGCRWSL